ncbi:MULTISPECIES: CGNR zinc finger domain-containing protein [unclassified Streptomyces]|uniref:CGNR zinc finger domain-containing protein n=1 Tax=unclassified Streptomyces TaxID=2593676 RepID=UPI002DDA45AE|nr:CGNR zinc finger domain-containing protein [Streptomyces sp. NBC_01257]WRZ68420.1 CGNR zinc finger domain-containing protein [Streptomyces sp. NBC_01257]WSU62378.1 CGNR zinc finger domain-containing protein [Streptomyces sp. NBC_01104]
MNGLEPLTGEPLALDLLNTLPHAAQGPPVDHLADPAGLRAWLALEGERLPGAAGEQAVTQEDVAAVRAVRAHAALAVAAARRGERPPASALRGLNEAQLAAPAVRYAEWDGTAVVVTPRRTGPLGVRVAAALAGDAAGLLADPAIGRVRECEAADCTMLFVPAHPRRRWCSAARCGNRARVARYYQRHKADGPDAEG